MLTRKSCTVQQLLDELDQFDPSTPVFLYCMEKDIYFEPSEFGCEPVLSEGYEGFGFVFSFFY